MSRGRGGLLQILGVAFGLAVTIGNTIGIGILRTPGDIAAQLPSVPWFLGVWLLGGVYALLGALTLAELGAMIPESGGQYVFARRALGEYAGFTIGWTDTISSAAATAAITISMGEYSDAALPALANHATPIAVVLVLLLLLLNWRGIRSGDLIQQVTSLIKMLVLVGLAVACLFSAPSSTTGAELPPVAAAIGIGAVVLALQGVIYTYDGWNGMLYFSGEVKNPGREVPRAMAGGVLLVVAIYLLLLFGYLHVLSLPEMAGQNLVAAVAARRIFGVAGDRIVRAIILVSLLSSANAILLVTSRVPYAMGRDGLAWRRLADVNPGGTPVTSLLLSTGITIALILTGTFQQVLALAAFFYVIQYAASFTAVLVLRRREPNLARPYRAVGYPWVTGLLLAGSLAFLLANVKTDTRNSLWSVALLALSYPVHRMIRRAQRG